MPTANLMNSTGCHSARGVCPFDTRKHRTASQALGFEARSLWRCDRSPWHGVAGGLTTTISGKGRIGQMATARNPTMQSLLTCPSPSAGALTSPTIACPLGNRDVLGGHLLLALRSIVLKRRHLRGEGPRELIAGPLRLLRNDA